MSNDIIYEIRRIIEYNTSDSDDKIEVCRSMLQWLLGGKITHYYNEATHVHYFVITNDDIVGMVIDGCDDAFMYEPLSVRISRMCEEYDGYMRYKYRDYKEK